jgi:hypothetical protein
MMEKQKDLFHLKTRRGRVYSIPPLIFQKNSAEISTFSSHLKVAGLHRVCPSTTLDKSY